MIFDNRRLKPNQEKTAELSDRIKKYWLRPTSVFPEWCNAGIESI